MQREARIEFEVQAEAAVAGLNSAQTAVREAQDAMRKARQEASQAARQVHQTQQQHEALESAEAELTETMVRASQVQPI